MKKLLGLLLLSTFVQAATLSSNYDQQFLNAQANRNFVLNSGAEKNDANVTDSSSIHSRSTSSPLAGLASHLIDGTGSSQNVDLLATSFESELLGTQCEALFRLSGDGSLYTATMRINSADVTTAMTLPNTGSYSQPVSIVFPCGVSGVSPVLRITSTSASAAAIKLDSVYVGRAVSLGNVNQVQDVMSWTPTGSWVTNTTYTGKKYRVGDRGFYEVKILLSGAPTAASLTINMPSGEVIDTSKLTGTEASAVALGSFDVGKDASASYPVGFATLYNSTTSVKAVIIGTSTTAGIQLSVDASTPQVWASGDELTLRWSAPIVGWTTTSSYSLMNTYWKVDANLAGGNISLGTSDVTDYASGVLESSALTLTNNSGTGNIAAQVPCSSTNSPSGTTCSAGSESVGVAFTPLGTFPQDVEVCAQFTHAITLGAGGSVDSYFQFVETPVSAQTTTVVGRGRGGTRYTVASTGASTPNMVCGTFTFSAPGQRVLRLRYEQDATATITGNEILADAAASYGERDIHITVTPLSYNTPAPILVGGVTSGNTTGGERVERAYITNGGTPAVSSQSGSWITSVTDGTTGINTLVVPSGIFSAAPTCTCSIYGGVGVVGFCIVEPTSATSIGVRTYNSGASLADVGFQIKCQGPR